MKEVEINNVEIDNDPATGVTKEIRLGFNSGRDFLLFYIKNNTPSEESIKNNKTYEKRKVKSYIKICRELKVIEGYLENYIETFEVKTDKDDTVIDFTAKIPEGEGNDTLLKLIKKSFESKVFKKIVQLLFAPKELFKTGLPEEVKKGKFKRSGHLTDQMLRYSYPKDKSSQLSIFDSLMNVTKKDIEKAGVEVTEIVEGIKLSPSETKIIDCLCKLLHESSQILEPQKEDYYAGNIGYELVEYGGDKKTPAPKLSFTLYELTREYKGGESISGKDVENVKQILTEIHNKRFLLSYVETTRKKDGGRIERKVEDFRKILHIIKISQTEYSKEDIELSKKEETVILLNPIFRRQIDSKFILYPNDINRRTTIAYGSHNLSEIALRLRDYLMRELSSKHYNPEINLDKLYYLLAEKWMKESRKKKVKEYTDKAIETVKALGLLLSYEIKPGATGEPKVIFSLNKVWE